MSNVYATEPATSGRVIFETTRGPIEVQLWCRECPEATRVFLQLCLDGYYDNMIFHRIIPKTLIQTGALRYSDVAEAAAAAAATSSMDQYRSSIRADYALERRRYELHSRLRFNHRGLVAMALASTETDNDDDDDEVELQPQFFITLEEASYLDGKHVIFGKVDAPTIFNAMKIGDTDVDENTNQPTGEVEHAPRIKSVKIVDNPIHTSIVPQEKVPWRLENKKQEKVRKKKRKGKRDMNVLSFGDEVEHEGDEMGGTGMKSSHDLLKSKTLSKTVDEGVMDAMRVQQESAVEKPVVPPGRNESESKMIQPQKELQEEMIAYEEEESLDQQTKPLDSSRTDQTNGGNKKVVEKPLAPSTKRKKEHKSISAVEARRAKYMTGRKSKREREEDTMGKLSAFQSKVRGTVAAKKAKHMKNNDKDNSLASRMARRSETGGQETTGEVEATTYHGQVLESDGEEDKSSSWLQTRFKCRRHMDHHAKEKRAELGSDGRGIDDYKVIDEREKHRRHHKSHSKQSRKRHKETRHDPSRQNA